MTTTSIQKKYTSYMGQGLLEVALVTVLVGVAVIGATQALKGDFEEHITSVAMLDNPGIDTTGAVFTVVPPDDGSVNPAPFGVAFTPDGIRYTDASGAPLTGSPLSSGVYSEEVTAD